MIFDNQCFIGAPEELDQFLKIKDTRYVSTGTTNLPTAKEIQNILDVQKLMSKIENSDVESEAK